jgi:hypothetical protein
MSLSSSQQKTIQDFCLNEPKTVSQIASKLLLEGKSAIMQLYNFFKTKTAKTLFYIENSDGFLWIRTNPLFFIPKKLDLIHQEQSSPDTKIDSGKAYKKLEGLKRTCPEKTEAALILNRVNKFCYYDNEKKEFTYLNTAKDDIDKLFSAYCNRVKLERIVVTCAPDGNPVFSHDMVLPYKTRFTDPARQQEVIEGFRAAYKKASKKHMKGVFLTLTSQPNKNKSLWEINQTTKQAWGLFTKFLNRTLPARAEWIKTAEFQQNGMLHYHIMIFGINWLCHKSVIQYAWRHYGGGSILDIHTIRQDYTGWHWSRSRPSDAAGKQPGDHLQSYLEKSMSPQHGAMYWATGIQAWTCSKSLLPEKPKAPESKPLRSPKKHYFLKGVLSALTGFRSSHRKDSLSLFAVNTAQEKPNKPKKEKPPEPEKLNLSFTTASQITKAYLISSRGV